MAQYAIATDLDISVGNGAGDEVCVAQSVIGQSLSISVGYGNGDQVCVGSVATITQCLNSSGGVAVGGKLHQRQACAGILTVASRSA